MPEVPDGVVAKLARVQENLVTLERELREFRAAHPYRIEVSTNREKTEHYLRIFGLSEVSASISLLVGEILYHLRSSLDHLVYTLVKVNCSRTSDRTGFPVFTDPAAFWRRGEHGRAARGSGLAKIEGMSEAAQRLIESLQPYHALESSLDDSARDRAMRRDELFVLNELARIDRHRMVSVVRAFIEMNQPVMKRGRDGPVSGGGTSVVLTEGLQVYHCSYTAPTPPDDVRYPLVVHEVLDGEWAPEFAISSEGGIPSAMTRLAGLANRVETVVQTLAAHL